MEKEGNYSLTGNIYPAIDYSIENQQMRPQIGETSADNSYQMVDYMLNNPPIQPSNLSFADVMQLADFGPKLALNQGRSSDDQETAGGIDPVYFLKFPVLNDKSQDDETLLRTSQAVGENQEISNGKAVEEGGDQDMVEENNPVQLRFLGKNLEKSPVINEPGKNKRKRPRTVKTSEEVESQRMTHIAVERNRRKQMNEHLRVLRSLMPGSYVQRGDQASIIGGAIEFVRELEQLLQCLESQKRRRLYGDGQRPVGDPSLVQQQQPQQPFLIPPVANPLMNDQVKLVEYETGLHEETAESKSFLADVEVKVLGFDALIKILSRRRPGQLIKAIAALEDLQLNILHTNITTIEQTVLYSFNVKITGEARFTAEDIANSVQQIFSFIHAEGSM